MFIARMVKSKYRCPDYCDCYMQINVCMEGCSLIPGRDNVILPLPSTPPCHTHTHTHIWCSSFTFSNQRLYFNHLSTDVSPSSEPSDICQSKSKNVNYKKKQTGRMWNSTRTLLGNFYRPFVLDLAAIMNDTKFLWDY